MTVTITFELWHALRVAFAVSFVLSLLSFVAGDLPDHEGSPLGNALRYIAWPTLFLLMIVFLGRGLML